METWPGQDHGASIRYHFNCRRKRVGCKLTAEPPAEPQKGETSTDTKRSWGVPRERAKIATRFGTSYFVDAEALVEIPSFELINGHRTRRLFTEN